MDQQKLQSNTEENLAASGSTDLDDKPKVKSEKELKKEAAKLAKLEKFKQKQEKLTKPECWKKVKFLVVNKMTFLNDDNDIVVGVCW